MIIAGRLRGFVPVGSVGVPAAVRVAALVAALAGVGVAGCSGGGGTAARTLPPLPSTSTPAPTASSSPTAAATTSAPAVQAGPPPRTAFTRQGAEQFVRAYYLTASRALVSGDTVDLRAYETTTCECLGLVEWINGFHEKGQHFVGRGFEVHLVRTTRQVANSALVRVTWSMRHMPLVDRRGRQVDRSTAVARQTDTMIVYFVGQRWHVGKVISGS